MPVSRFLIGFAAGLLCLAGTLPPAHAQLDNATCLACHGTEGFKPFVSKEKFEASVHGPRACVDCHKDITAVPHEKKPGATAASSQLAIVTQGCGGCHADKLKTFKATYHGQVATLGYAHAAKCFDCHGSHDVQRVSDPRSTVHPDNRLNTCQKCHEGATAGFVSFHPHGNTHDFERYPQMWLTAKFMIGLLAGTFAFFWGHGALWFYREYKERKARSLRPHVNTSELPKGEKHYRRFSLVWRLAHLLFALSLMVLTLTGMTLWYADSAWAPVVMKALGGPEVAGMIQRVSAVVFAGIFFAHLVYMLGRVSKWRSWDDVFGPNSLIPGWQDLMDAIAMFKWFFGKGPRPVFDRWTYWEKFDYWAPFWGVTIIGVSGFMLWFPNATASVLPGWVFNVATITHGEEAFLAAVFLFTVHFFNNHFRPDKFPIDVVMFTGTVPIEHFKREHALEYERLVKTGELGRYLVDAPSRPMTLGSKILGFTLIAIGLILLALVVTGFVGSLSR